MSEKDAVPRIAPRLRPRGSTRISLGPSAEFLAALEEHPLAEFGPVVFGDGAVEDDGAEKVRVFEVESETSVNHGCPHCGEDFSITGPERAGAATRILDVTCPLCDGPVLVPVSASVDPASLEVGPGWDLLPPRGVRNRVLAMMREDPELAVVHAERIARLEADLAEARHDARTDPVTGLLNERAHMADTSGEIQCHGVMRIPLVEAVYDRCGQASGNRAARDAASLLLAAAAGRVPVYRLGNGKFGLIGSDDETMQAVLADIQEALRTASVTAPSGGEGAPRGAASILEMLDRHEKPYGLAVRMRPGPRSGSPS